MLSTRNHAFAKFIAQIIRLCAEFPENRIKTIWMDNAGEFTSKAFNDYCMALGINVEHSVPHVHTQNGLAESLIKRIKLIARPLLQGSNLPTTCWGHAVLHAAKLIQYRPSAYHSASPRQLARGQEPVVSHLRKFSCAVYVPISPPQRTAMGPHRKVGVYVGYESPSIIYYLEPKIGDLFTARYADCIFDEEHFPALGGGKYLDSKECREIEWNSSSIHTLDPRSPDAEQEVQRIIHLQNLANDLPDAFTDLRGVSKLHIPAANAPERVEIPMEGDFTPAPKPRKRGRDPDGLIHAKRRRPQELNTVPLASRSHSVVSKEIHPGDGRQNDKTPSRLACAPSPTGASEPSPVLGNQDEEMSEEIATDYAITGELYNRKTTHVDINFVSKIAEIVDHDLEPKSMAECRKRSDWVKWKEAIET